MEHHEHTEQHGHDQPQQSAATSSSSSSLSSSPANPSLHPQQQPQTASSSNSSAGGAHSRASSHGAGQGGLPGGGATAGAAAGGTWRDRPLASSTSSAVSTHSHSHPHPHADPPTNYANAPELTHYLVASFVPSVVPQPDEYAAKEQARVFLEKLAEQVSPGARLLPFGSMANGFALKNSDMDLCCFLGKDAPVRSPSELVELLGRLIEQETNFYVKTLPRARIPIIKLTMPPTPSVPQGMACDIGFENRLALENTRLLLTYAMVDARLRILVLFLKVWTKRRKINNPYRGTLSSYGYVLLVIHFLEHVKQPPVLPNLQRLPLPTPTALEELTFDGHDISFFDDLDALPSVFQTLNTEPAGELLIDFFRYFAKDFGYAHSVISIKSEKGTVPKVSKGWHTDFEFDPEVIVRDQHKLCIEDPFQLDYNVARTVTRDGLYTIRGEFMRAFRLLTTPARGPEGISQLLNSLCEEREDYLLIHPADSPYPSHHHPYHPHAHPHPHSSPQHLAPQAPKSPRRRSAPSPRLNPQQQYAHQPPPMQHSQREHPLWAAAHGAGAVLSQPHAVQPGGSVAGGSRAGTPTPPSEAAEGRREALGEDADGSGALGEALTPTPGAGPQLHPPPASLHPAAPLRPPSGSANGRATPVNSMSAASSVAGGSPRLERRSSFDAMSAGGASKAPSVAGSAAAGAAAGGAYDLHRFFQNPVSSSTSDVGGPTASSSSSAAAHLNPRTVSLTAPSSPDMAASSAYFAGHPPAYGYAARQQYRYASSSSTAAAAPYSSHVGPRLAASVPRNPHTAHHAYTNPYASAPAPAYPLSSSTSSTASASSYTTAATNLGGYSTSAAATPAAPAPIFPEEDREAIALANSITFGNFPEMLPLPSYAHYHASGGSAAYLSGGGGWGSTPYGISGPMRVGNRTHGAPVRRAPGTRRSLNGLGLEDVEDDDEAVDVLAGRGRRLATALEEAGGESGRSSRTRGRSVPHVRMGPDGRETLLFGAIEVTLPKAEDVEEAEQEEVALEQERERERERVEKAEEEKEVAFLGPSPPTAEDGQEGEIKHQTADEIPPRALRSIPTLTTQPPTPAKAAAVATTSFSSSSDAAASLPPLDLDLDRESAFTTAPTSPTRVSAGASPSSPLTASHAPPPEADVNRTPRASSPSPSPSASTSSSRPNGWSSLPPTSPTFVPRTPPAPLSFPIASPSPSSDAPLSPPPISPRPSASPKNRRLSLQSTGSTASTSSATSSRPPKSPSASSQNRPRKRSTASSTGGGGAKKGEKQAAEAGEKPSSPPLASSSSSSSAPAKKGGNKSNSHANPHAPANPEQRAKKAAAAAKNRERRKSTASAASAGTSASGSTAAGEGGAKGGKGPQKPKKEKAPAHPKEKEKGAAKETKDKAPAQPKQKKEPALKKAKAEESGSRREKAPEKEKEVSIVPASAPAAAPEQVQQQQQ
ncbi:hypothetical protein JCM10213_008615 [Rhodosporidiobolus nylandii]